MSAFRARVDFPELGPLAFDAPARILVARARGEVVPLLDEVERAAKGGRWAVGWIAYEAAPALDRALRARPPGPGPLACFGIFDEPAREAWPVGAAELGPLVPEIDRSEHRRGVEAIRTALGAGGAYQVNLTHRLRGRFAGDPFGLFERLRAAQGRCHGACIVAGDRAIVSASPELFFERRGAAVRARPMKGTRPRGRFAEEDADRAEELAASPKERAENVMIADLLRNDLGRVALPGEVQVSSLHAIERYRTVLQMVSTIEARLPPDAPLAALLRALFPCGSVTGAPKASAMAMIAELERSPRGVYCGAVGVVCPGGDAVFNVPIRTVEIDLRAGTAACGVGGGITWGSRADEEWEEAAAKAAFLEAGPPPALIETLRLEDGRFPLLERHLSRLAASAVHLGIDVDVAEVRRRLLRFAAEAAPAASRVRLVAGGPRLELEAASLPSVATEPQPVALAKRPVSRWDARLFHKTTERSPYDSRRAEAPADLFDVLLWNEEGEATELTIGNLVAEIDGVAWTPPRECGLLAGVMRAELLERGELRERVLRVGELERASRLWLVNAVRGRVPIRLVERP